MSRLLLTFAGLLSSAVTVLSQTLADYVNYINEHGESPKEYIFERFKYVDVIILGERDHRDTTQYDLILDIIGDPRFSDNIGFVYTEVGVTNMTGEANNLIKDEYADDDDFYKAFLSFYREMDYENLWEKYNGYKFIRGLYDINRGLPIDRKITWGLTDRPWIWTQATYEDGEYNRYRVYQDRDRKMADNFLRLYGEQPVKNGRRKALVITNAPHAMKSATGYYKKNCSDHTQGSYIVKALGKKHVDVIMLNSYHMHDGYELFADGAWDAAFEITGCKPVAVSFRKTPFGQCKDPVLGGGRWSRYADGLIFYVPFYKFKNIIGIPGILDNDFMDEYIRRDSIINNGKRPLDFELLKKWHNTTREVPHNNDEGHKEQLQKWLTHDGNPDIAPLQSK